MPSNRASAAPGSNPKGGTLRYVSRLTLLVAVAVIAVVVTGFAAASSPPGSVVNAPPGGPPNALPKSFTGTPPNAAASGAFAPMPGQVVPDTFSPAGCYVQANDPHKSTSVPGAASGDAFVRCNYAVPLACVEMALYRDINGTFTAVGDNDFNYHCDNYSNRVTVTSKENPCVHGAEYMVGAEGYSKEGGEYYYGGPVYSLELVVC